MFRLIPPKSFLAIRKKKHQPVHYLTHTNMHEHTHQHHLSNAWLNHIFSPVPPPPSFIETRQKKNTKKKSEHSGPKSIYCYPLAKIPYPLALNLEKIYFNTWCVLIRLDLALYLYFEFNVRHLYSVWGVAFYVVMFCTKESKLFCYHVSFRNNISTLTYKPTKFVKVKFFFSFWNYIFNWINIKDFTMNITLSLSIT